MRELDQIQKMHRRRLLRHAIQSVVAVIFVCVGLFMRHGMARIPTLFDSNAIEVGVLVGVSGVAILALTDTLVYFSQRLALLENKVRALTDE